MWKPIAIQPGETGPIPLLDLAIRMGRIPRFGAAFRCNWWSVLHHSICMDDLAFAVTSPRAGRSVILERRLYALSHDAHEAATGDVPTPWKTSELRQAQHALTLRVYRETFKVGQPSRDTVAFIKRLDGTMMHAEGITVGPAYWSDIYPEASASDRVREIIDQVHKQYPRYEHTSNEESAAVAYYIETVETVLRGLRECTS